MGPMITETHTYMSYIHTYIHTYMAAATVRCQGAVTFAVALVLLRKVAQSNGLIKAVSEPSRVKADSTKNQSDTLELDLPPTCEGARSAHLARLF